MPVPKPAIARLKPPVAGAAKMAKMLKQPPAIEVIPPTTFAIPALHTRSYIFSAIAPI